MQHLGMRLLHARGGQQCNIQRRHFFDKLHAFFSKNENALFPNIYETLAEPETVDVLRETSEWRMLDDRDYGGTSKCYFHKGGTMYTKTYTLTSHFLL